MNVVTQVPYKTTINLESDCRVRDKAQTKKLTEWLYKGSIPLPLTNLNYIIMSTYLQLLDKRTQSDIKRLCARKEGLTVDVFENHSGENVTTKETFKDVEKCAEFVYSYQGNLGTALSFNYQL